MPDESPPTARGRRLGGVVAALAAIVAVAVGVGFALGWWTPHEPARAVATPVVAPVIVQQSAEAAPDPVRAANFIFHDAPVPVPDLAFVDSSGAAHKLSDFRGRPVVLNLWAIWCVPCRWELPSLDRLQGEFDPNTLLVLPLSGDSPSDVQSFYGKNGVAALGTYTATTQGAIIKLGFSGFPGTVLIDANGNEIGRKIGPLEWDDPGVVDTLRQHFGLPAATAAASAP